MVKIKRLMVTCFVGLFVFFLSVTCYGYEFQIVKHFKSPLEGGIGDLTYSIDGYLYATKKTSLGYENRVFKIAIDSGEFVRFFEHPSEPINQLRYMTSCNGALFVDHYSLLFNYVIYKIYPEDEIWTTFLEPDNQLFGGMACDGFNLILTEESNIYTVNLSNQEETGRNEFMTLDTYEGMTWDGEYLWGITNGDMNRAVLHKIDVDSGMVVGKVILPSTLTGCRGLTYDGEAFWTYVNGFGSPYAEEIVQVRLISGTDTTTISTTTIPETTSTTTSYLTSTSTTPFYPCLVELVYGEDSKEVLLWRNFRDTVLKTTPEGRELIRIYYLWSPFLVKALREDESLKETVKAVADRATKLILGE